MNEFVRRYDLGGMRLASNESIPEEAGPPASTKRNEIVAFAVLAVLIWPVLAVAFVGGYGFLVWMYQMAFGPPGPPG